MTVTTSPETAFPFPIYRKGTERSCFHLPIFPTSLVRLQREQTMPGIDFDSLRRDITMEQVLHLLQFEPTRQNGDQWYGPCPLHESSSRRPRYFSVNVKICCYYCHQCHSNGNQLQLWAAATGQPLHQATIQLCRLLARPVPWITQW
jgi:hypothetical protein